MNEPGAPDIASVAAVAGGGRVATFFGRLALTLVVAIWVAPLYWLVNTAFKIKVQIQSPTPVWFPNPITLDNLQWVYENLEPAAFERSLRVVAISVGIAILPASRITVQNGVHFQIWDTITEPRAVQRSLSQDGPSMWNIA